MEKEKWKCPTCTFMNRMERPGCEVCSTERPPRHLLINTTTDKLLSGKKTSSELRELRGLEITETTWDCAACTFKNDRKRPGCKMCGEERPIEAMLDINSEKIHIWDCQDIVVVDTKFECRICIEEIEPGDGMRLRDCGCEICRSCCYNHILINYVNDKDTEMKCPGNDCEAEICQRDIKGLLEDEEWAKFLRNMYERGQFRVPSTHCHTPNCPGWAELVEEKEKQKYFLCSRCSKVNCITCDAQHDKQTCDEYQKEYNDANDLKRNQIKLTEKLIEEIIHVELGMKCAHCSQLIMKKDGCDWIKCKCGLELCWPTKGPRWGPKGHGDTTGGCRCGVDGKKCHQSCANCH